MALPPSPKIKKRVNVKIEPSSNAPEDQELDYRVLVAGDFSKTEIGTQGELQDRKLRVIKSKRDFKKTLEQMNPKLKVDVRNRMSEDPEARLEVNLDIKDMKDFHPDVIVGQVEPLKKLMSARDHLKQLKVKLNKDRKFRDSLEAVLKEGSGSIEDLMGNLGEEAGSEEDKKQ